MNRNIFQRHIAEGNKKSNQIKIQGTRISKKERILKKKISLNIEKGIVNEREAIRSGI